MTIAAMDVNDVAAIWFCSVIGFFALATWTLHIRNVVYETKLQTIGAFFIFWFWFLCVWFILPSYIAKQVKTDIRPTNWPY